MPTADTQLLERWISERDSGAFHELVRRHAGLVLGVTRRILGNSHDSEDVAQDCFFELARTRRPPRASVTGWLHALATHRSIDQIKSNVRRRRREEAASERRAAESEQRGEWQRIRPHVDEAIDRLPADLRRIVVAHFLEQKTHRVVAGELGLSRQTVTHRIGQAIERIRKHLERRGVAAGSAAITTALAECVLAEVPRSLVEALGKIPLAHMAGASSGTAAFPQVLKGALLTLTTTRTWTVAVTAAALVVPLAFAFSPATWLPGDGDSATAPTPTASGADTVATPTPPALAGEGEDDSASVVEPTEDLAADASEPVHGLRGRVVDARGTPVADARVAAGPERKQPVATSITARNGQFEIALPEAGEYAVRAFHPTAGLALGTEAATSDSPVELALSPLAVLGGRVIDAASGEPIEEIGMSLGFFGRESAETRHALSWFDADREWHVERLEAGRYRFDGLPAGKYHITFEPGAAGYAVPGYFGVRYLEIILVPGEVRPDFDIALARGGAISGRVLDPSGRPVADARINVTSTLHTFRDWPVSRTDDRGRYQLSGLAVGGDYLVVADHGPLAQSYSEPITLSSPEEISGVDVQLLEGHTVAGQVIDEGGAGIADARVSLSRDFGRQLYGFGRRPMRTDPNGAFAFDNVAPGPYNLVVHAGGFDDSRVHPFEVGAEPGSPEPVIVLSRLLRTPGVVAGRVTDIDGLPLGDIRVLIQGLTRDVDIRRETRTDSDGRYRFDDVGAADRFRVSVYADGYTPAERDGVDLGSRDVDFAVVRHGSVAGRVVDALTGEPVSRFEVRAISYRRDKRRGYAADWIPFHNENGVFLLDGVEPPGSSIGVRAPGYAPLQSERLEIEPETLIELELALQPGATFAGRIIDALTGRPVRGARVRVYDRDFFHSSMLNDQYGFSEGRIGELEVTGADGQFAFRSLPPRASFDAVVWHAGHGTRLLRSQRAPTRVDVPLEKEVRLAVEIHDGGAPVEGLAVSIERPTANAHRSFHAGSTTDRRGSVELEGLPSGRFVLELRRIGGLSIAFLEFEFRPGEVRRLRFDLAELSATMGVVRGTLVGLSGAATIWIQPDGSSARLGMEGCSSEEPDFMLTGLPPGRHVLHVLSSNGELEQAVEVRPGAPVEMTLDITTAEDGR